MRVERREDGATAVWLDERDYERLRRVAGSYREDLVLRLCAEAGLTPPEVTRVTLAGVTSRHRDGVEHYRLAVPDADGGVKRQAYLPPSVEHDLRKYARANDVAADEPVIDVSPRRVQMLVVDIGERAAERTGESGFRDLSSRDLRRYFARRLLDEGVNPRVLLAVGGWERLASLDPYFDPADEETVLSAFERVRGVDDEDEELASPRLDGLLSVLPSLSEALAGAADREAVFRVACERLAAADGYRVAWVEAAGGELLARVGAEEAALAPLREERDVVDRAVREASVQVARDLPSPDGAAWDRTDALAAVPVFAGEDVDAVLCLVAPSHAFGERERALLADLGHRLGAARAAAAQRRLLLSDTAVELTFDVGEASVLTAASAALGCTLRLAGTAPVEGGTLLYFVRAEGVDPGDVLAWANEAVLDARLIRAAGAESLVEFAVAADTPVTVLAERGGSVRELVASGGQGRLVVEFAGETDVRSVVETVTGAFPDADLAAKREVERPARTTTDLQDVLDRDLTGKQQAVLRAAFHAGYFEWPRGSTAEELADSMGVSSPTLHNHLRKAQQKLLAAVLRGDLHEPRT